MTCFKLIALTFRNSNGTQEELRPVTTQIQGSAGLPDTSSRPDVDRGRPKGVQRQNQSRFAWLALTAIEEGLPRAARIRSVGRDHRQLKHQLLSADVSTSERQ